MNESNIKLTPNLSLLLELLLKKIVNILIRIAAKLEIIVNFTSPKFFKVKKTESYQNDENFVSKSRIFLEIFSKSVSFLPKYPKKKISNALRSLH